LDFEPAVVEWVLPVAFRASGADGAAACIERDKRLLDAGERTLLRLHCALTI
jgi:hypothetical protein